MAENGISELEYVSELAPCTTLREGKWKMRLRENGGLNENVQFESQNGKIGKIEEGCYRKD